MQAMKWLRKPNTIHISPDLVRAALRPRFASPHHFGALCKGVELVVVEQNCSDD
jgi:hypothetical protein